MATRDDLGARCNRIEEAYEFMLAYAAQGLASEQGSNSGTQVREFLSGLDTALEMRDLLTDAGIDLGGEQQTKTKTALEFFSEELRAAQAAPA